MSSLVYTLTEQNKLDEDLTYSLWTGPVDYEAAEYEINQAGGSLEQEDGHWGVYGDNVCYWLIDPVHNSKEEAIDDYFASTDVGSSDGDLDEYRQEVFEHWIVSSWLGKKLIEQGETVVEDVLGINYIWCRCTTGQAIYCDDCIISIYKEMTKEKLTND